MIRRVNHNGEWYSIEFSDIEVNDIRNKVTHSNAKIAKAIFNENRELPPEMLAVLTQQSTQHFIYALDDVALEIVRETQAAKKGVNHAK